LASRNEQRHPTKSKGNGRTLLGECAGISARRLITIPRPCEVRTHPVGRAPLQARSSPGCNSPLPKVCGPHTYLTDGNPPRSSRGQTKVSTSNSGTCLDSALAHPLLHWTVDQLSAPRNRERCSAARYGSRLRRLTPRPEIVPAGLSQSSAEEQRLTVILVLPTQPFPPPGSQPFG